MTFGLTGAGIGTDKESNVINSAKTIARAMRFIMILG